jgi:hypothetical protein
MARYSKMSAGIFVLVSSNHLLACHWSAIPIGGMTAPIAFPGAQYELATLSGTIFLAANTVIGPPLRKYTINSSDSSTSTVAERLRFVFGPSFMRPF